MAGLFLTKLRHGSIFYFRQRVPQAARQHIGRGASAQSLETSDRRTAVIRSRALATQTDAIFQRIAMATKSVPSEGFAFNYEMRIDFHESGAPSSMHVNAEPHEEEAVNSAIRTVLAGKRGHGSMNSAPTAQKPFSYAIPEYFSKSQTKAQTKATYRSELDHAKKFFGDSKCVLEIDQADFVGYCDHVLATVPNTTLQDHYMTTVATLLNWFRIREAGLPALTTKTLVPKRDSPESDDRDAFSLEQLGTAWNGI